MFETIEEILSVAAAASAAISMLIGFIVTTIKSIKNKKNAKSAETTNDINKSAMEKVIEIEKIFSQASHVLKATGIKTGEIKKENVLNFIRSQCAERGIEFDSDYWSAQIESFISIMNVSKSRD